LAHRKKGNQAETYLPRLQVSSKGYNWWAESVAVYLLTSFTVLNVL